MVLYSINAVKRLGSSGKHGVRGVTIAAVTEAFNSAGFPILGVLISVKVH